MSAAAGAHRESAAARALDDATGGARNNSTFPKASAAPLNITPGDAVQAVDGCVVAATLGR
ncbi:hypothetical protein D7D52_24865 [Nocardia yunnanensis]|uniref:Uncharacterized protein n=1 Tax=Nocardia yunnanensis TaxID=2382165 RepID=A0A386ZH36_9NOCA|nr:hypothetical protein D7D52_24865 [Nocardia yunnanensis]